MWQDDLETPFFLHSASAKKGIQQNHGLRVDSANLNIKQN